MIKFSLLFVAFCSSSLEAAIIEFDLLESAGSAGEAFEANTDFTDGGLTIGVSGVTTLGSGSGMYSANGSRAGFNSFGITGVTDVASGLDLGETLTFTLNFVGLNVSFISFNFAGIGSSSADSAFVSVGGAGPVELFSTQPDFNGTLDLWSPAVPITIADGDTVVVTTSNAIDLEAISFDVAAVPEPSSIAFLGLIAGGLIVRRVRRQRNA